MNTIFLNGNIADVCADVIVLPANVELKEGPGSSKAIFEKAGRKNLQKACKELLQQKGKLSVSEVAVTPAFALDAEYIFHAIVPKWIDGNSDEYFNLMMTYVTALCQADDLECRSIAFPLLASGHNGYNLDYALEIALKAVEDFIPEKTLETVYIVLYGQRINNMVAELGFSINSIPNSTRSRISRLNVQEKIVCGLKVMKDAGEYLARHPEKIEKAKSFVKKYGPVAIDYAPIKGPEKYAAKQFLKKILK